MSDLNISSTDNPAMPASSAGELLSVGIPPASTESGNNDTQQEHTTDLDAYPHASDTTIYELRPRYQKKVSPLVDFYSMDREGRGDAVIINNENFDHSVGMPMRRGSEVDARNLKRTFTKLGFKVHLKNDASCQDIHKIFQRISSKDHTGSDCFMCAILSHGDDGCVYGTNGTIKIRKIVDMFRGDVCPSLAGKPKIFIFQACRGTKHEIPVSSAPDVVDGFTEEESEPNIIVIDGGPTPTLPSGSDFLFCYSVAEGFYSHRDTLYGSWYVQDFTTVLESLVFKKGEQPVEFLEVLTAVNKKVSERTVDRSYSQYALGKKQMPCFLSMLTKKLYFL